VPNARVLVVDDYPGTRYRRMRILLDAGGFNVAEASLGREAVARASAERYDLVIVDLHLPDIDGCDVCRELRAAPATATVPILMVSAVSDTVEAERRAVAAGATAFMPETSDEEIFLTAVRTAIAGRAA